MTEATLLVKSWVPITIVAVPLASGLLAYLADTKYKGSGKYIALGAAALCLCLVLSLYPIVLSGAVIDGGALALLPPLGLGFRVDYVSYLYILVASFVWPLVLLYATTYMDHFEHEARFFSLMSLNLAGCLGVGLAGDLFTLFVFFELISLAAYVLIIHEETPEAMKSGFKYLIMSLIGSLALFFGVIGTYEVSGTLSLSSFTGIMPQDSSLALSIFIAFLLGFGIKAGTFPLHVWLPDAHPVAPTPASAVLSGIMVKAGAFGLIRVLVYVFGLGYMKNVWWTQLILWGGLASMVLGSGVAILQDDLKRRFAYSSIGQMGYITAGVSMLTKSAFAGAAFHIWAHALAKACLFLCIGAIYRVTGQRTVGGLVSLGRRMPITMGAFALASLSMIGIPPFNGFVSKWSLSIGALDAGHPEVLIFLLVSSLMAGVYCLPLVISAFFSSPSAEGKTEITEAPVAMLIPIVVLAFGSLVFSLVPGSLPLVLSQLWSKTLPLGR